MRKHNGANHPNGDTKEEAHEQPKKAVHHRAAIQTVHWRPKISQPQITPEAVGQQLYCGIEKRDHNFATVAEKVFG
jgi:hypothetical protein